MKPRLTVYTAPKRAIYVGTHSPHVGFGQTGWVRLAVDPELSRMPPVLQFKPDGDAFWYHTNTHNIYLPPL